MIKKKKKTCPTTSIWLVVVIQGHCFKIKGTWVYCLKNLPLESENVIEISLYLWSYFAKNQKKIKVSCQILPYLWS